MSDPREAIAQALSGFLTPEQTKLLVDEVLAIKKQAKAEFNCRKCGARQYQYGEISDAKAVSSALTDLTNQAFGRPTEASTQNDPVTFVRLTKMSEIEQYQDSATIPKHSVTRNSKVRKGQVRVQSGSASRKKTQIDKSQEQ